MEKHDLKSGFSIYFADVHFEKQVYALGSGLGFTSVIYTFSENMAGYSNAIQRHSLAVI